MTSPSGLPPEAQEAWNDPAEVTFVVVGRNGHRTELRIAVSTWENGHISYDMQQERRTFDVFDPGDRGFTEPIPFHRRVTFSLDMAVPGVRADTGL